MPVCLLNLLGVLPSLSQSGLVPLYVNPGSAQGEEGGNPNLSEKKTMQNSIFCYILAEVSLQRLEAACNPARPSELIVPRCALFLLYVHILFFLLPDQFLIATPKAGQEQQCALCVREQQ